MIHYAGSTATGTSLAGAPSALGTYTVVASFPGGGDYGAAASAPTTFTMRKAMPVMTVVDAFGAYSGSTFPATARVAGVSGSASSSLEGLTPTLTDYAESTATGTPLASAPSSAGTYTAVAGFPGSADYIAAQSSPITFTIGRGSPTVGLSPSAGAAVYGQPVSFVATVTATGGTPTGTVTFSAGGTVLGTVVLDGSGTAMLKTSDLAVGSSAITATYNGSASLLTAASGSVTESVARASTQIVLVPPAHKVTNVRPAKLGAIVNVLAPGAGAPTGTVTFEVRRKNKVRILGTSTLSDGTATLTRPHGLTHRAITVVYDGNADYLTSMVVLPAVKPKLDSDGDYDND